MMKESMVHSMSCSGGSAERYQQKLACSIGSKVVSCCGFAIEMVAGWVFLER